MTGRPLMLFSFIRLVSPRRSCISLTSPYTIFMSSRHHVFIYNLLAGTRTTEEIEEIKFWFSLETVNGMVCWKYGWNYLKGS